MKFVRKGGNFIMKRSEVTERQSFAPVSKDAGSAVVTLRLGSHLIVIHQTGL